MTEPDRKALISDLRTEANFQVESGDYTLASRARRNLLFLDLVEDMYEELDKLKAKTIPSALKKLIGQ